MAILKDSDVFNFDKYRQELAETGAAALMMAQSTEAGAARMRTAYDGTIGQLTQMLNGVNAVSTAQTEKAGAAFKAYEEQIDRLAKEAERYRTLLKTLDDSQSANSFSINEMTRLLSGLEKEYKSLKPEQADFAARQKEIEGKVRAVSLVLNAQNAVLREAKKATDQVEGSYAKLSAETNDLRTALRQMPGAFDPATGAINKHNKAAVEMLSIVERNDRALKTMDASMGNHQRHVGDYTQVIQELAEQAINAAGGILGITSAIDLIGKGLDIISEMERIDSSLRAVSKDTADFKATQEFLIGTADRLGLKYEVLAKSYKGLKAATNGSALEGKSAQQIFTSLVNAGAALKLSNDEVEGALEAVTQMMSKGKVQAEELRGQLGERLPGAIKVLAEAMGISETKLNKMLEQGELLAVDVLPKLAKQLDKTYGKDAQSSVETMAGGWNKMTNQVHLFLAALNDNQAISNTATNFTNMISEIMKGLRVAVQSNDWKTFFGYLGSAGGLNPFVPSAIGDRAKQQVQQNARNQSVVDEFKTMTPAQRDARIGITQDNITRNEGRLKNEFGASVAGGNKAKVEATLKADRDLLVQLRRENLKLAVKDRKDADQAEINATRAADAKKEADKEKAAKDAKKAEAARRKAQTEADRKLNDSLNVAKAGTDETLAGLANDKQDGLISEKEFIEQRQKITLDGIAERQAMLQKAGKKESDDYKRLSKDKLDAETLYKRDSLKLSLSDSKSATSGALASLATDRADGTISESEAVEKKLAITVGGIRDQQRLLEQAGQSETKLYKDTEEQINEATRVYYKERLKIATDGYKKELDDTRTALSTIDSAIGEEYAARLKDIQEFYDEKERIIAVDVALGKITGEEGEARLHAVKMNRLTAELDLTEDVYAKDRTLSNALINGKIAQLEKYKSEGIKTPKELAEAEEQILKLKQIRDKEAAEDKKKLDNSVADNAKKRSDETKDHDVKNSETALQKRQQLWSAGLQLADTIGQSLSSIQQAYNQQDSDNLEKQHDRQLAMAGDNADAKARIEANYQRQKNELARKAAIQEREAALFSIAINTAQAVMSVLSTGGGAHYLDFGVSAGILSAFVTAAGIAQAAAVLAKPLPAFWTGTSSAPEGFALVGDRGPELRQKSDGSYRYYDRPTVDYLDKGDRIYTASQTAKLAADWMNEERTRQAMQESLLYGQTADRLRTGVRDEKVLIQQLAAPSGPQLSKSDLKQAFGEALDARPQELTILDEYGVRRGRRRANNYQEYLEKRTAW